MHAEWFLLLVLVGAGSGAVSGVISYCPMLITLPTLYFFAPFFDMDFSNGLLPIVATSITAFIPVHLHQWIRAMKSERVDFQQLINFAPGVAMGGMIGAQLMSILNTSFFMIFFSVMALVACFNLALRVTVFRSSIANATPKAKTLDFSNTLARLPIGLSLGCLSLLSANCGKTLAQSLLFIQPCALDQRQGTATGLAVFASIAAMVGFAFPALEFDHLTLTGFAGAIHLPSLMALSLSHCFFYWLSKGRGNALDKSVLIISLIIFLMITLVRIWFF